MPFPDTAYYLGSAYLKNGELALAEQWLKRAEKQLPRDFRVPDHLARVYQRAGRRTEAEREYSISAGLRRSYNEASQQAVSCSLDLESESLKPVRPGCQALFDRRDPDKLTTLGILYGQHGDYADAMEPLQFAAKLDPDSWEIEHDLGLTYFRLRRYADARPHLERAAKLRPDFFGSNALLGATLFTLRDDEAAYRVLKHAYRLNPADRDTSDVLYKATLALAQKAYRKKDYLECLSYLQEASGLQPGDAETHRRLSDVYRLLGRPVQAEQEKRYADNLASNRQAQ
jgi:Flp pilus assembly protein TadD